MNDAWQDPRQIFSTVMAFRLDPLKSVVTSLLLAMLLAGCAVPDRRLVEDEQSCQRMGHPLDSSVFKQCMADLDARRCDVSTAQWPVGGPKGVKTHVATKDCTALH